MKDKEDIVNNNSLLKTVIGYPPEFLKRKQTILVYKQNFSLKIGLQFSLVNVSLLSLLQNSRVAMGRMHGSCPSANKLQIDLTT